MAKLNNPTLYLTFLENDIQANHDLTQVINSDDIVYHSLCFKYQLLNGLKSSSNQISLQLYKTCSSIEDIIVTNGDIKAILKDGSKTIFTGYLSSNHNWSISSTGESVLNLTVEDVGTKLLVKSFIKDGEYLINSSAYMAIYEICTVAGISIAQDCAIILDTVIKKVERDTTCKDILEQLLYELGYVYYFNEYGNLLVYKIECTSTENLRVIDKDYLYCVGNSAINIKKSIRKYNGAKVTFTRLGTATDYLIYRNTTGKDDTHPYCYFSLKPNEHFDGVEIYDEIETEDTFRTPSLVQACNAKSETEIVGSNEILSVDNVSIILKAQTGSIEGSINNAGGTNLLIDVKNNGSLSYYITQLDAIADIVFVKDTNIISTTDTISQDSDSSSSIISEEVNFIHTKEMASYHANLISQYYRYANTQYEFYSTEDLENGSVITLFDNLYSGLKVNVLIFAKTFTDQSDIIKYLAVGISKFDLTKDVYYQSLAKAKSNTKGEDGKSFSVVIESSNGALFRFNSINTTLTCKVYQNAIDITDTLEDYRFKWVRKTKDEISDEAFNTSSKALYKKSITVESQDCLGRTVFNCEVDLENI